MALPGRTPLMRRAREPSDGASDESLLAGMAQGDERAGLAFVRRYQGRVFGLAMGMVSDAALAEDIAQEALLRAWRHAPVYDSRRGAVSTWVLTITRNLTIDALRMRRAVPTDPDDLVNLGLASNDVTPEASAASAESARELRLALAGLSAEQRRALVLAYFYGMTALEVSEREVDTARDCEDPDPRRPDEAPRDDDKRREPSMSGDDTGQGPECGRYADEIAELALGISTGRERALALAHVEACPRCHAEMEHLSLAADSLLEVVPAIEPPLGFEVRLMERLGVGRERPGQSVRRQWFVRRASWAMACLLLLVAVGAGVGTGWLVRGGQPPLTVQSAFRYRRPEVASQTASLLSAGRKIGDVTVYSGRTTWLFMSLEDGSWSGKATCQVRLAGGKTELLGTFWLENGYGAWGVTLAPGTGHIRSASVLSEGGRAGER